MTKIKLVGVLQSGYLENNETYVEWIQARGFATMLIPYSVHDDDETVKRLIKACDAIVCPGGADVHPSHYNATIDGARACYYYFDIWQLMFVAEAVKQKKKIFGICRGHQLINVYFNGSIIQNLDSNKSMGAHYQTNGLFGFGRGEPFHRITSILNKKDNRDVNSMHHQGITTLELGNGLMPLYESKDTIIEIMKHEILPILSVQFHPEEMDIDTWNDYFEAFVNSE